MCLHFIESSHQCGLATFVVTHTQEGYRTGGLPKNLMIAQGSVSRSVSCAVPKNKFEMCDGNNFDISKLKIDPATIALYENYLKRLVNPANT